MQGVHVPAASDQGVPLIHPMQDSADIGIGQVGRFAGKKSGSVRLDQNQKTAGAALLNGTRQRDGLVVQLFQQAGEFPQAVAVPRVDGISRHAFARLRAPGQDVIGD